MDNLFLMQMLNAQHNLLDDFGRIFLRVMDQLHNAIEKFPTSDQLKNQKVLSVCFVKVKELHDLKSIV